MISEFKTGIRSYTILASTTLLALMMALVLACGGEQTDTPPSDTNRTAQAAPTATLAATSTPKPSPGSPSTAATMATASVPDAARDTEKRAEDQSTVTPTTPPAAATTPMTTAAAIPTPTSAVVATQVAISAGSINCGDFQTWGDAQQFFFEKGGPDSDEYGLDTDGDWIACNAESDQGAEMQPFEAPESAVEPQGATPGPVPAPVPPTVVAAATQEPTPEPTPASVIQSEAPLREYTPKEIGAVDWRRFEQDGHLFARVPPGGRIIYRSGAGVSDVVEIECGPEIGSSLDSRSSLTWSEHSHVIWVWYEDLDPVNESEIARLGCIQVSKYEDWPNKEAARATVSAREIDALRAERQGEDLVFFYQVNDRSYTMPPGLQGTRDALRNDSPLVTLDSDFGGVCWAHQLPNALWSEERGFIAMPDEDVVRRNYRTDYTEEMLEIMQEAREAGWYYVYGNGPIRGIGYGCWHVGNPEEVPVEPCIACDISR